MKYSEYREFCNKCEKSKIKYRITRANKAGVTLVLIHTGRQIHMKLQDVINSVNKEKISIVNPSMLKDKLVERTTRVCFELRKEDGNIYCCVNLNTKKMSVVEFSELLKTILLYSLGEEEFLINYYNDKGVYKKVLKEYKNCICDSHFNTLCNIINHLINKDIVSDFNFGKYNKIVKEDKVDFVLEMLK